MANGYGLYDMSVSVWEWCNDWHDLGYYDVSPNDNPRGPSSGSSRVSRGGSWNEITTSIRSARRGSLPPEYRFNQTGFRVVGAPDGGR